MKNKGLGMLLIAMTLLIGACAKHDNVEQANMEQQPSSGQVVVSSTSTSNIQATDYKKQYQTSLFLGDSITEGLSFHDVLDKVNVLAGAGKTAEFALMEDDVDKLVAAKPEHIFIHLGSTDILWPTDNPQEHSLKNYEVLIDAIQDKLPDATISLLSVLPVTAEAEQEEPRYANIEDYNEGLQVLAKKMQVKYIDLTSLVTEHPDLYDTDGIHFQAAFYPLLLNYISEHSK